MIEKIKEWKGKIMKKAHKWEIIDYQKVIINKDRIIINKNNEAEFKAFFFCFALPFILITSIFLMLIMFEVIYNNKNIIGLIIYICFISPFYLIVILGFQDFFWNKQTEWNIDCINQNITLSRIRPNFKQLKKYSFSDVKYLIYEGGQIDYLISLHISRFKCPVFFHGMKVQCEVIGKILAKNIGTDLYYRTSRVSKKYKIWIKK